MGRAEISHVDLAGRPGPGHDSGSRTLARPAARRAGMAGTAIYRIYKGPDEQSAMAFLKENPVTQELLYLVVETPEGNFCRDLMGVYKED